MIALFPEFSRLFCFLSSQKRIRHSHKHCPKEEDAPPEVEPEQDHRGWIPMPCTVGRFSVSSLWRIKVCHHGECARVNHDYSWFIVISVVPRLVCTP